MGARREVKGQRSLTGLGQDQSSRYFGYIYISTFFEWIIPTHGTWEFWDLGRKEKDHAHLRALGKLGFKEEVKTNVHSRNWENWDSEGGFKSAG